MQDKNPNAKGSGFTYIGTRPVRPDGIDKVTGRAKFGADMNMPGQLVGRIIRSPHPHARILAIDTSAAEKLEGVKAVVTAKDFLDQPSEFMPAGEMMINYRDVVRNVMAREKVLYEGHAVAAIAATTLEIARAAAKLVKVTYEVLPHVVTPEAAMAKGAPILDETMVTVGVKGAVAGTNIAKRIVIALGDVQEGFKTADIVVERTYRTKPVHQGYIEPHACVASVSEDGQADLWVTTQGHWIIRAHCAKLLGWDIGKIKVTASEIGGGFGGKTVVYFEPVALALSQKARRPVKIVMSREDVFRATGPTSGAHMRVKIGATKAGKIVAAEADLDFQAGAFAGSPVQPAAMCAFACYDIANVHVVGQDIVTNTPKVAAYRAPGGPIAAFAVETTINALATKLGIEALAFRLANAAKEGTQAAYGPKFGPIGLVESLEAAQAHAHFRTPLGTGPKGTKRGRGMASGFWFNIGGETTVSLALNEDGSLALTAGTPDIGGLRASLGMMAAEELGVKLDKVRVSIGDTQSLGYNFLTGGSRATFSSGLATVEAARQIQSEVTARAAKLWDLPIEAVEWSNGSVRPAGPNAGKHKPMTLAELARMAGKTGGPIVGYARINAQGAAPSFATHLVDVEVDMETGRTTILRYTALQDAGRAIHPSYVEGQFQGGVAQGIGWALNEEYIYGDDGRMLNAGFLDYRVPVASDLPMIDTHIVEVPNPNHPYGVRGVGETPICPPMAAIANAISDATGLPMTELPMSPPRVLALIDAAKAVA